IDGEIIDMAPIGSKHVSYVNRITRILVKGIGDIALVSVQNPVVLGDLSEPEPDFALLKPKDNDYEDSLPEAEDVLLLIEVADTTLNYDKQIKATLSFKK
ncbi:MAG: Uma2 family endonuclease, partial [Methylococcaceae bacterium]|nr:Uma2 family endonuclease [Methylococcaceae bacterium]